MKSSIFLILLFPCATFCQNINFSDQNFKAKLIEIGVDTDGDEEISESEALVVENLLISSTWNSMNKIQNLDGLEFFTNITSLNFSYNEVSEFSESIVLPNLIDLNCSENLLTELNINNLPKLEQLNCSDNDLNFLHIVNHNSLRGIDCQQTNVSSLILKNLPEFKGGLISGGDIYSAEFINLPSFTSLGVSTLVMDTIRLLDFPQLSNLALFTDSKALILENVPNLETLDCSGLETDFFSINELTKLERLGLPFGRVKHLNIKNGQILDELYLEQTCCIEYLCVNDSEIARYEQMMSAEGFETVINSYCTYEPGGFNNIVKGNALYNTSIDDCILDGTPVQYAQYLVEDSIQSGLLLGNEYGFYSIHLKEGDYTITPTFPNKNAFEITPASRDINFSGLDSVVQQDFCVIPSTSFKDLEISILPLSQASPGFEGKYKVIYRNIGTVNIDGLVKLFYPGNRMTFQSSSQNEENILDSEIHWTYDDLSPFETRTIEADFIINSPMDEPPVNGGDILGIKAQVLPLDGDENRENNLACFNQQVFNSFDPNDKTCLEGNVLSEEMIGEFIHYLIRFENTGTANAQNIVLKDILDQTVFDVRSLQIVDSSHDLFFQLQNSNIVEFVFKNINLPFEDGNDGFVLFKIKTLSNLSVGDVIENKAEIFFDFNFPIITNTTNTVIESVTSNKQDLDVFESKLFPNPFQNELSIFADINITSVEIYDLNGILINTINYSGVNRLVDLSFATIGKGEYFVRVISSDGKVITNKVVKI